MRLSTLIAPEISQQAPFGSPIIIVGMLRQSSGLGAAARACHDALRAAGFDVYGIDLTRFSAHDANHSGFDFRDGRGLAGGGTVFLHVAGSRVAFTLRLLRKDFVRGKRIVAHWFWELPKAPAEWRLAAPFVHDICVNTRFVADAVRPVAGERPVHVVPYPLALDPVYAPREKTGQPFTVLVVFNISSNFPRKNPCAAIAAFRLAFDADPSVRLVVKYANAFAWPEAVPLLEKAAAGVANIELIGDVLADADMDALYGRADVVMSLHRAEGLGLVVAEAMSRGLPVIATDWSATAEFLDRSTGIPIRYRLVPVQDPQGNYHCEAMEWAEPDIDDVAAALLALRANPELRAELGRAAATRIRERFRPENYARVVQELMGMDSA